MRHKITLTYLGTVTGFLALLLLNYSVWLEMRVNTALILPLFTLVGFAVSFLWTCRVRPAIAVALQFLVVTMFVMRYGVDAGMLKLMPAMLLREGFLLGALNIQVMNLVLIVAVCLGNLAVISNSSGRSQG